MTDELRVKIESLRAIAPRLNAATDEAAKTMAEVEKTLDGMGLGVEAEVFVSEERVKGPDEDAQAAKTYLCYGRFGGKFRFYIQVANFANPDNYGGDYIDSDEGTAWTSCHRGLKLQSYAKLPELLGMLADASTRIADQAEATTAKVRDAIAPFRGEDAALSSTAESSRREDAIERAPDNSAWKASLVERAFAKEEGRVINGEETRERKTSVNPRRKPRGSV